MIGRFCISKDTGFAIVFGENTDEAVQIAARELAGDIYDVTGAEESGEGGARIYLYTAEYDYIPPFAENMLPRNGDGAYRREGYAVCVRNGEMHIAGADRRGTVYGIYELSKLIGVSPWRWWADVPVKKRDRIVFRNGFQISDYPSVEYRGVFINDEEELENWSRAHMNEDTIGVNTYKRVFGLLLRLKANYIWPAMHVNSFNVKRENGELADRMGIIIGTSHCDMLMRSNNREWSGWLERNGLQGTEYDYSIEGQNRENLDRYWRESVIQNSGFEVSWTLGMRGIHDWGMSASVIDSSDADESERLEMKKRLLETVISRQRELIREYAPNSHGPQIFIPYKEVLELYNAGLSVPDDVIIVRVNDNFGYVRSYPDENERKRSGGHGLYYHVSYWAAPGMDYLFLSSLPHAHMKYELEKAYENGIQKLWVLNVGAIKPLEQDIEYFLSLAWDIGKEEADAYDVKGYIASRIDRDFSGGHGKECADILTEFAQVTNTRKLEHMKEDAFSFDAYVDEWSERINRLKRCYDTGNKIYFSLPEAERNAFFELVLMKIHAAYYINSEYYYADRSRKCFREGRMQAAEEYTECSLFFDSAKRKMIEYYNNIMADGKWSGILTPEQYPPPVYAMHPACSRARAEGSPRLTSGLPDCGSGSEIHFYGDEKKWIELANTGSGKAGYIVYCRDGTAAQPSSGTVSGETRLILSMDGSCETGEIIIRGSDGTKYIYKTVYHKSQNDVSSEKDFRIIINAGSFKGGRIIEHAGRYEGGLIEAAERGETVKADFYVHTPGCHMLELHRFPSLNSNGRIRAFVSIDGGARCMAESDATDEWRGRWRENVMDNIDRIFLKLPYMDAGYHTLSITAADKYFAFSRAVIYTGRYIKNDLGIEVSNPALPERENEIPIYGSLTLKPRPEIFTRCRDWSGDRLCSTNICVQPDSPAKPCSESKYGICLEREGDILIDASRAFENDDTAYTENGVWQLCNSASYGGNGMAVWTEPSDESYTDIASAPKLHYNVTALRGGKYIMWILTKVNDESRQSVSVGVDGEYQPVSGQFMKGNIWSYEAKQIWRWIPFTELDLEEGRHTLSIASVTNGMRIDRIFLTQTDKLPPVDKMWG